MLGIGLDYQTAGRTGGVHSLVVQKYEHTELFGFFHRECDGIHKVFRQIAICFGEALAGVDHEAGDALFQEGVDLTLDLLVLQIVIPKPKRNGAKFCCRVQKGVAQIFHR